MKIARVLYKKRIVWGEVKDNYLLALKEPPFNRIKYSSEKIDLKDCSFLPPAEPQKIILAGLNYRRHAEELKMPIPDHPLIFLKPPSSLIGQNDAIIYPACVKRLDYEAELAVVIGKKAENIDEKNSGDYIFGLTCLNDVTARDLQKEDGQWTRAKSFDTFCPLGPWVETDADGSDLDIKLYLNGEVRQNSSTRDFIFSIPRLVSFISGVMTLFPGDVIATGTPSGIGPMKAGDIVEVEIENIGRLINRVKK